MGNKIRIKQIDLQGIFSASNQVDILSASNYAQFVTQLDTTMSSDAELSAVSSSISQSIYTINQVIGSGLISGSSQLTSSYDTRYILSGSITQTTWDNIDGKPSGLVSESTDLSSLNQFTQSIDNRVDSLENLTGSYATTGSNVFRGNQIISGSVSILIPGGTATGLNENSTPNNIFWSNESSVRDVQIGWTAEIQGGGTYTVTNVQLDVPFAPFVAVTLSDESLALGYRVRINFSKNSKLWQFNNDGTLTGLPSGIISGSSQIANLGFVTGSFTTINTFNNLTQSFNSISQSFTTISSSVGGVDFSGINAVTESYLQFTQSYQTDSSSFDGRITTEKDRIDAILSASNANTDTFAEVVALINSVDLDNDNAFATFYTSSNARISSLENATGSYLTSLNGALSSSSQLTGSFDERYTLSGSSVNINTGSFATTGSNTFSGSQVITGSLIVSSIAVVNGGINVPTGSTLSLTSGSNIFVDSSGGITGSFSGSVFGIGDVTAFSSSLNNRILSGSSSVPVGTVSGSSQLTASYDTRYALSSSLSSISSSFNGRFNGLVTTGSNTFSGSQVFSGSMVVTSGQVIASTITNNSSSLYLQSGSNLYVQNNGIVEITGSIILNGTTYTSLTGSGTIPSGTVSGSSQLTSSYDLRYTLSGSVQPLPSGVISGSSQLTSSFDTRYALSGSGGGTIPAGTISGSSQLTSSFDGRYVQTGSFNTLTASFNSFTASAQSVTTGSNSFNGTQTITGSLIITTGSFVGSQILANTSSLYLTSGSNMYVQNNGVVEITGSLNVRGTTRFETVGGDEGGEIEFGVPQTNTSLSTRVVQDIFQNRLRIFDGNTNGVFIDLSKAPIGVAGEITWKSSGIVNAGTFVQLDNIKATVPSSGNRALALATVSGTISGYISGHYQGISSSSSGITQTVSLSTSTSTSMFGWNFAAQGDTSHYILRDDTNNRVYRFILMIGNLYNNNFISIERLH